MRRFLAISSLILAFVALSFLMWFMLIRINNADQILNPSTTQLAFGKTQTENGIASEDDVSEIALPFDLTDSSTQTISSDQFKPEEESENSNINQSSPPLCSGPGVMNILLIGVDSSDEKYLYGLADVIRIVKVDFAKPQFSVLTIPRDLWVEFPSIKSKFNERVEFGKLNQAYFYGGPGMGYYDGINGGPGLLAETIEFNYGYKIDRFVAINMSIFVEVINAIGGIDLYLEQDWDGRPVDDQTIDLGYFPSGQYHMDGDMALRFSRIRKKYSEVARTDNQTLVLCAIKDKLVQPEVIVRAPLLIYSFLDKVQTDLTLAELSQLTCMLKYLRNDNLNFVRFPDQMLVQGKIYDPILDSTTFIWDIPREDIRSFLNDFLNDKILNDPTRGTSCP